MSERLASNAPAALRVLVADDDRDNAESLALLLAMTGHQTAVAFDGWTAMAKAVEFAPAVVILDLDMPIVDGFAVAKLLAQPPSGKDRPYLIALTAKVGAEVHAETARAGFDFYMPKPADVRTLLTIVQDAAQRHPNRARPGYRD